MLLKILQKQQRTRTRTFCGRRSLNRQLLSDSGRNWSWIESLFLGVSTITQSLFADKNGKAVVRRKWWSIDGWMDRSIPWRSKTTPAARAQQNKDDDGNCGIAMRVAIISPSATKSAANKQTNKRTFHKKSTKLPFSTACFVCCLAGAVRVLESATEAPRLSYRVYFHLPGEGGKKIPQ